MDSSRGSALTTRATRGGYLLHAARCYVSCGDSQIVSQGLAEKENVVEELLERVRRRDAKGEHGGRYLAPRDDPFLDGCVSPARTTATAIAEVNPPRGKETQILTLPKKEETRLRARNPNAKPVRAATHLSNETMHTSSLPSLQGEAASTASSRMDWTGANCKKLSSITKMGTEIAKSLQRQITSSAEYEK